MVKINEFFSRNGQAGMAAVIEQEQSFV
jgi:hypothetical protein